MKKMGGLCWLLMVLALFPSPPNILAAVDQSWLTSIVAGIKNEYELGDSFSVAVNIPQNQDPDSLQQVLQNDPADQVKEAISQARVYNGTRVVAATQPHALTRVLQNIQPLIKSSDGNVLVIYSEGSPGSNDNGITSSINNITHNWGGYAFAFSNVTDVPASDTSQLTQSFKRLHIAKLGLNNIFRCYKPGDDTFQCTTCSSGGDVAPSCVENTALSSQEQGTQAETPKPGLVTGLGAGIGAGIGTRIGNDIDTGIGSEITAGSDRPKEKGGQMSKCKGRRRGSCRRRGGGKLRRGGKRKKGRKLRRGGKRKKGRKLRRGGKRKKGRKLRRGGKRKKGRKLRRGGKRKKGRKLRRGGKRKKGRKLRRGGKRKKGRKLRRGGKRKKGRKLRRGGKRKKGRKLRRGGKRKFRGGRKRSKTRRGSRGKRRNKRKRHAGRPRGRSRWSVG